MNQEDKRSLRLPFLPSDSYREKNDLVLIINHPGRCDLYLKKLKMQNAKCSRARPTKRIILRGFRQDQVSGHVERGMHSRIARFEKQENDLEAERRKRRGEGM